MSTPIDEFESADLSREFTDPVPVTVVLRGTLDDIKEYSDCYFAGTRWPRLRQGDREPISGIKRKLVYERDGGCCRNCGYRLPYREAQIDHIIPWSAYGSDCSCNLRILCEQCNTARSNFRSGLDTRPRHHVTLSCTACQPGSMAVEEYMLTAYCGRCGNTAPTCPDLAL